LVVKEKEFEDSARINGAKIKSMSKINPMKYVYSATLITENDVPRKFDDYKNNLKTDREAIINNIENRINPSLNSIKPSLLDSFIVFFTGKAVADPTPTTTTINSKIIAEYQNVFNGLQWKFSRWCWKDKNIPGIKSISPNQEEHITMMDSVPLIGADKVWKLDSDGNNCAISGKQCLTGKNVTIGIIDTGIDYTHPDLVDAHLHSS